MQLYRDLGLTAEFSYYISSLHLNLEAKTVIECIVRVALICNTPVSVQSSLQYRNIYVIIFSYRKATVDSDPKKSS